MDAVTLSIIVSVPTLTPSSLSRYLKLPPHRVSRLLAALAERGLVKSERASNDGRSKIVLFTAAGQRAAAEADVTNRRVIKILSSGLSPAEQEDALELLTALADDMCPFSLGERGILAALLRLTACLGMQGDNYADTGMSLASFQILFDLWRAGGECPFKDLVPNFPLSASSLSRECDALQLRGFVKKKTQLSDRRSTTVVLTPEGSKFFLSHHNRIGERLSQAARFVEPSRRDRGLAVLTKLAHDAIPIRADGEPLRMARCTSASQRQRARAFLVEELVRSRQHLALGSSLLPPKHECFFIMAGEFVRGIVEFEPGKGKVRSLHRLVCEATMEGNELQGVLREVATGGRVDPQSIRAAQVLPPALKESVAVGMTKGGRG
jgi:DNA-binding MarR family transcriptional regulator